MHQQLIHFFPLYKERVWGGRTLESALGRSLPESGPIGESWDLVDREEDQSVVASGPYEGLTIRQLLERHGAELLGPAHPPGKPFPILVKWLDCADRLSLQVHPPAAVADELGGEPKTENWFIVDCRPDSALIVGLRSGVSRQEFEKALHAEKLESCVHRFPVEPGNSILVESGRLHAIDAGNLILEIQQNSDTTYRVYDWGRKGLDGQPRQLHLDESLRSIDFEDFEPKALPPAPAVGEHLLAECPEFRIRRLNLRKGEPFSIPAKDGAVLLHGISGELRGDPDVLHLGETVLLPFGREFGGRAESDTILLLTDRFS